MSVVNRTNSDSARESSSSGDLKQFTKMNSEWNRLKDARSQENIVIMQSEVLTVDQYLSKVSLPKDFRDFVNNRKNVLGNYIYIMKIKTKDQRGKNREWEIRRRLNDFKELRDKILKEEKQSNSKWNLPAFPQDSELKDFYENLKILWKYLEKLNSCHAARLDSLAFYEFIEYSLIPISEGSICYKQGYLKKRTGGRYKENLCQIYCGILCRRWMNRWFVLTDDSIVYTITSQSTKIREMLLFDQSFQFYTGRKTTGTKVGITLITPTRKLTLKAKNLFDAVDWVDSINRVVFSSPYTSVNRYFSYAPVRKSPDLSQCKWYITAENYFPDICDAIESAQHEIFITDWWLSPELHLKRPVKNIEDGKRLDFILKERAERGVKIYIIVYQEVKLALYNNSLHTKKHLEGLHKNIQVIRHPSEVLFLWSHHEKMLVVDQRVGFMGGIDLCFGRYDTQEHPLFDPAVEEEKGAGATFPGSDFSNSRVKDFVDVKNYTQCQLDKRAQARMPWQDIAIRVTGAIVRDLSRHFIQYWNFAKIDINSQKKDYFLAPTETEKKKHNQFTLKKENSDPEGGANRKKTLKKLSDLFLNAFSSKKNKNDDSATSSFIKQEEDESLSQNLIDSKETPRSSTKQSNEEEKFEMNIDGGSDFNKLNKYQPPQITIAEEEEEEDKRETLPKSSVPQLSERTDMSIQQESKLSDAANNNNNGDLENTFPDQEIKQRKSEVTFDGVSSPTNKRKGTKTVYVRENFQ